MKYFLTTISILLLCIGTVAFATDAQMKDTLVKIVNQLQAIKPLINQAQQEQSQNPRIKIHFDTWKDAKGKKHNGLRQDIEQIQQALITAVNGESVEPRSFAPIGNDFTGDDRV